MYLLSRGTGYPVLFIHGMPTSSQLWNGIIERLRGQFTCLAVDLPGLGRSPSIPYCAKHLELLAEKMEEIRIQQGFEKWHVVGHDAGSAVAIHYAHRFPERVDHLVLLSPAVFPELKPFPIFRLLRVPVLGEVVCAGDQPGVLEAGDEDGGREATLGNARRDQRFSRAVCGDSRSVADDVGAAIRRPRGDSGGGACDAAAAFGANFDLPRCDGSRDTAPVCAAGGFADTEFARGDRGFGALFAAEPAGSVGV